jgi:hypothetical protein
MKVTVSRAMVIGFLVVVGVARAEPESHDSLLTEGARIRFWTPVLTSNPNIAEIKKVREDELAIVLEDREDQYRLGFEDIERVEVSVGKGKNNTGFFAVVGAVSFGLFSVMINSAIQDQEETGSSIEAFLGGVLVGGAGGALLGWAVSTGEKWEEVPASFYQVDTTQVDSQGSIFALTISF